MQLDGLCDTETDPLLRIAERRGLPSAWWVQVPFGQWVVRASRPGVLVELGTAHGVSYAALCQAVRQCGLATRCFAVDCWDGDDGIAAYEDLRRHDRTRNAAFSRLLRDTFDAAVGEFADGSIDLLHIDGEPSEVAARHAFATWLPKLSDRAVVLLHGIAAEDGVGRFWAEMSQRYPSFAALHGQGLGLLAVGSVVAPAVAELCALADPQALARLRGRLESLGSRWQAETQRPEAVARADALRREVSEQDRRYAELQDSLREQAARAAASAQARDASERRAREIARLHEPVRAALARVNAQLAADEHARLEAEADLATLRIRHQLVVSSTSWRMTWPVRRLGALLPEWLRRGRRQAVVATPAPSIPIDPVPQPRPSDLFRAHDQAWTEPAERPEFARLRDLAPRGRIAVVAHVYYPDLWPEIAVAIGNLAEPFDLFVTLVAGAADGLAPAVRESWPFARVMVVDNHGRDIVPFIEIIRTGVLFRYELVCKLHTKRSFWHEDGDAWRQSLIGGVLGSPSVARAVTAAFRADPDLGLVVADGQIYSGRELWVGNEKHLLRLFRHFGMDRSAYDKSFAGGSIYWIRAGLLRGLADLHLGFDDFEIEPLDADGSMAHAVERLVSLICYHAGATIKPTSAVMQPAGAWTERA